MYNQGMETTKTTIERDWEEVKTAQLLAAAKRSGFFADAIEDAKYFKMQGFTWDVSLAKACKYWCN